MMAINFLKNLVIITIFAQLLFSENYLGYIRTIEASFCMDDCSDYYLETETGEYISNIISYNDNIDLNLFSDRFVNIDLGNLYLCIECEAIEVLYIQFSNQCINPVECIVDPCSFENCGEGYECFSNYCGGCYADCISVQYGDINHDGIINILDIVSLVAFILFISIPTEYQFNSSDIDQNNTLNILDIVAIISIVLE